MADERMIGIIHDDALSEVEQRGRALLTRIGVHSTITDEQQKFMFRGPMQLNPQDCIDLLAFLRVCGVILVPYRPEPS